MNASIDPSVRISRVPALSTRQIEQLGALAERARRTDGRPPFAEDLERSATSGAADVVVTLTGEADELVGAAFAARQGTRRAAELLVDPDRRGQGYGTALLNELLEAVPGELWLWSHGDHPAARRLAARAGLERARELLQLRRSAAAPVPETQPPPGVRVRPFVPGQDEQAWVAVNAAAFAWHPEQGAQTLDDIRAAEAEPWFDPDGFFLAVGPDDEVLGFHWTKIHRQDGSAVGEVYVLGVAPHAQGERLWAHLGIPRPRSADGLGTHLTAVGLNHLAAQPGVREIMLYVEGANAAALKVYERLGFTRHAIDVAYRRSP
ncbi:mycothiol synthase [Phytoactinopolyspora halotolerans]|uniref:Mycothiol acetyltransferase n=1 Tax=Phytoactinopolyspora halotolerans TaxID=1981512 RepID=A0A6L9S3P8_9ACTN|nr:mycothiol synthase [Phytoactinopolyspora halotolerans]NED99460.1 mycothiol synthase [Phytoactinopolyspora halotolerans]